MYIKSFLMIVAGGVLSTAALSTEKVALTAKTSAATSTTPTDSTPQTGRWNVTASTKGMPFGNGSNSKEICLTKENIEQGFEKAFFLAVPPPQSSRSKNAQAPDCIHSDLKRAPGSSTWNAACATPRGQMNAKGNATFTAERFQGAQIGDIKTPMGKFTITRSIEASRLGECVVK